MIGLKEIIERQVEQKGLGKKLGELVTSIGKMDQHSRYATLVTDGQGFNVQIMAHRMINQSLVYGLPNVAEVYLFESMVSEKEARKKYDELK